MPTVLQDFLELPSILIRGLLSLTVLEGDHPTSRGQRTAPDSSILGKPYSFQGSRSALWSPQAFSKDHWTRKVLTHYWGPLEFRQGFRILGKGQF